MESLIVGLMISGGSGGLIGTIISYFMLKNKIDIITERLNRNESDIKDYKNEINMLLNKFNELIPQMARLNVLVEMQVKENIRNGVMK